jgi:hypothetical protein
MTCRIQYCEKSRMVWEIGLYTSRSACGWGNQLLEATVGFACPGLRQQATCACAPGAGREPANGGFAGLVQGFLRPFAGFIKSG